MKFSFSKKLNKT